MRRALVVNADDAGADTGRNAGIFEAIEAGSVTSVSILANGPAVEDAIARIVALGLGRLSAGLHFNLSEGRPLASGLRRVVAKDGSFLGKAAAHALFLSPGTPHNAYDAQMEEEIRMELDAQLSRIESLGVEVDHIDGHQHIHVFPAVVKAVMEEAAARGIEWFRIPEDRQVESADGAANGTLRPTPDIPEFLDEIQLFTRLAQAARPLAHACGLSAAATFRGLCCKGNLPADRWTEFVESIPAGVTEFMVHPGRVEFSAPAGPFSRFSTLDREAELRALTDGRFLAALSTAGVNLTSFPRGAW